MSIVITGASGLLGRHAAEAALDRVDPAGVILTTRTPARLGDLAARGADVRAADFDDPVSLDMAFAGADRLLLVSVGDFGRRPAQHAAAIDAAVRSGLQRIVYTSFIGLDPGNPAQHLDDHTITEADLRASGLEYTIMRHALYASIPALVFAPGAVASGGWISNAGDGGVAYVWREDAAEADVAALLQDGHAGATYEITGPELVTHGQAAECAARTTGRPVPLVDLDDDAYEAALIGAGVPPGRSAMITSFGRATREGWFAVQSDAAEWLLGRPPRSVEQLMIEQREAILAGPPGG